MKSKVLKMAFFACITAMAVVSCNSKTENKSEKVEEAKEELGQANEELDKARRDSANEYTLYREESNARLTENNKKISELKAQLKNDKKEMRTRYEEELKALELKNEKLQGRMNEYKAGAKENWESFKWTFNKDMDDLGKSISSMAERNMKK